MNFGIIITTAILALEIRTKKVLAMNDMVHHMAMNDMVHHIAMEHPVNTAAVMAPTTDITIISSETRQKKETVSLLSYFISF
jgi:hypothetical protein